MGEEECVILRDCMRWTGDGYGVLYEAVLRTWHDRARGDYDDRSLGDAPTYAAAAALFDAHDKEVGGDTD